ncbi:MAG: MOSC domain-containing protein [Desulfobulbaceae bacterium]|nr:MOSC domain-containing protein [Desulfobulbaceae bacterium]
MTMLVHSLNIGRPQPENFHGKEVVSGICKQPVAGPLALTFTGFAGDGVADHKHHGGTDKAVCAYSGEHYGHWQAVLGISMPPAAFGENLTLLGLAEGDLCIGDSFRLGSAVVQVSQPRQPCKTLAARFGRADFVKLVVDAGKTGWYFRVLEEGVVASGDRLTPLAEDPLRVTVAEANRIFHHDRRNLAGIERVLAVAALSASWQQSFRELLQKCGKAD